SAVRRAQALLAGDASGEVGQHVQAWRSELETVDRLEQIRMNQALPVIARKAEHSQRDEPKPADADENDEWRWDRGWDFAGADRPCGKESAGWGLGKPPVEIERSAEHIRRSPIKRELVAALDDWYQVTTMPENSTAKDKVGSGRKELLQIARLADPDPWRNR